MSLYVVNTILSTLNLLIHLSIILYAILYFTKKDLLKKVNPIIKKHAIKLAFIVALTGMTASLYYSNYIGFEPCTLCWFQRIFIYPQVFLLGLAIKRKDDSIIPYSIMLAIIGSIISIYHYIIQRITAASIALSTPCTVGGECSSKFVFYYGYITIPFMALTVGITIILLLYLKRKL